MQKAYIHRHEMCWNQFCGQELWRLYKKFNFNQKKSTAYRGRKEGSEEAENLARIFFYDWKPHENLINSFYSHSIIILRLNYFLKLKKNVLFLKYEMTNRQFKLN